jgi:hypothetical protein
MGKSRLCMAAVTKRSIPRLFGPHHPSGRLRPAQTAAAECGEPGIYRVRTMAALERVLKWAPGAIEAILQASLLMRSMSPKRSGC